MTESAVNDTVVNPPTSTTMPYNMHMDNFFGVLCVFILVFGTSGNILALLFFIRKKRDTPTIIYTNIALVDLIISILTLPVGISIFSDRNPVLYNNQIFCDVWGFVWTMLARMSVFLVALLSISRAYCFTFPFRRVDKRVIMGITWAAFVTHILGGSIPFWWNSRHNYYDSVASCIGFGRSAMPDIAIKATKVFDYLGMLVPVPVITVSFIVTMTVLKLAKIKNTAGDSCRQKATLTVAVFTGTYLFFNVPTAIVQLLYNFTSVISWPKYMYLVAYIYVMVIPLNSACNPIIYLWRMKQMREQSLAVFRCILRRKEN